MFLAAVVHAVSTSVAHASVAAPTPVPTILVNVAALPKIETTDSPLTVFLNSATGVGTLLLAVFTWRLAFQTKKLATETVTSINVAQKATDAEDNRQRTERTVLLIAEAASEEKESLFGFFDYAADIRVSREAVRQLFEMVRESRPAELRNRHSANVRADATAIREVLKRDVDMLPPTVADQGPRMTERELRRRVLEATTFFERVATLASAGVIDEDLFFKSQAYNVAATYYVVEPVLAYFVKQETFDFDTVIDFAARALKATKVWIDKEHSLADATFGPLEKVSF